MALPLSIIVSVLWAQFSWAQDQLPYPPCDESRAEYFCIDVGSQKANRVQKNEYDFWRSAITNTFSLQVFQAVKAPLWVSDLWTAPYFAGGAQFFEQDPELKVPTARINLYGGTIRSPEAKGLAFATMLCHEVGHFLGSGPRQAIPGANWSSLEGFSDDFAARVCLPELLKKYPLRKYRETEILPEVKSFCKSHSLCEQVAQAGYDFVHLLNFYELNPQVLQIQLGRAGVASSMELGYPTAQCRLETFLTAAACLQGSQSKCNPAACWHSQN